MNKINNIDPFATSHNIIYINTTIDTDAIINDSSIKISTDEKKPQLIDNKFAYMVTTNDLAIMGSGTGELSIVANIDDIIRWSSMSESANIDSSVIIYNISKNTGPNIFSNPEFYKRKRSAAEPGSLIPIPVSFVEQNNWYMQSTLLATGTQSYNIQFALYNRPNGQEQKIYSYFEIAASVSVKS
ncbi:AidA/PixA family protein [Pectobacterium carotovorum]|uniref:Inclusion body protein n=1 Tax=Pectobacterium carotovorum TaxID=554 RepID=A0A419ARB8_PECCA|nr:AidA/PixA family protein [Pectobacterium carotovorum]RJL46803.1 hypothetical protein D5071_20285 [Pectobacterium carotovorum]GLY59366.1 hypothetical protein Pcaca05_02240 [Pectobacterium carotovorum subsp. carotovorum]